MSPAAWLWGEIHDFFETDDGSLPEIRVDYLDTQATAAGYEFLRKLAVTISPECPQFCRTLDETMHPLASVSNPAALVVSGEVHPFHVVFGGIEIEGVTLPEIGIFVFPNQLALDYRMGTAWAAAEVKGVFDLLSRLIALDSRAALSLEEGVSPEIAARFHSAWDKYSTIRSRDVG